MAEVARRFSPYTYGNDNPLIFIDPDGMSSLHYEGKAAEDMFREIQREQEERDKKRGASDSPNIRAAEAKALAKDTFDASKPRASGRVENDYTLETFAIPMERGIVLLKGARGLLAKFLKFGGDEVIETTTKVTRPVVNLTEETFSQALLRSPENLGGYSIYGTKGLVGDTFNRNIFLLQATGQKNLTGLRSLIKMMEAEALGAGANKISIYGSSVINKGLLNPNTASRFGYTLEQSGSGVFLQKTIK